MRAKFFKRKNWQKSVAEPVSAPHYHALSPQVNRRTLIHTSIGKRGSIGLEGFGALGGFWSFEQEVACSSCAWQWL
jgi:hypothetical protein